MSLVLDLSVEQILSVEQYLNRERTRDSVSCRGHGNWESVVRGPSCDRGPLGFQHTLAVSLALVPWVDEWANLACECTRAAHVCAPG